MLSISAYRDLFLDHLKQEIIVRDPENLYAPIDYILNLGGKRLRPVLTLMTADLFAGKHEQALKAAMAIEIFHNFSLVHDDIMDDAPLRRGKQTVHEKWDLNTGILSGDAMLIVAYQFFEHYSPETFQELAKLFSKTAIEVCEGQQYDIDFETRDDVQVDHYIKMITFKTAVLVGAAMKMGAIVAKTSQKDANAIYDFGLNLGIAFQLMDDYLDAFGDPITFGKQLGGDIIENKKTFLYLKTLENLDHGQSMQLHHLFSITPEDTSDKIEAVKDLMISSGAAAQTQKEIENYTQKALQILDDLALEASKKTILKDFAISLMNREI